MKTILDLPPLDRKIIHGYDQMFYKLENDTIIAHSYRKYDRLTAC